MLDFNKEYILEDERVLLRPLRIEDHANLLPFSEQEPELWKYSLQTASGAENLQKYIAQALADRQTQKSYPFIVFDKQTKQYAGSTRFYDIQLQHQALQLGYTWYGKAFQGTGLNKHCKLLLLQFAFEELQMFRVEFRADYNNKRSIAAMKRIGCTEEGILRQNVAGLSGNRRDSIVLSILRPEWDEKVKSLIQSQIIR